MSRMKRLTGLHIENVQSISSLTLRLDGDGFYWIKGKSNIGKSALLKSIKALFTNVSNNKYKELIRDNEEYFTVTGYFEDDWVTLSRGIQDYYEWNIDGVAGREDKTNGKVPTELREYFNLYWTGDKVKRYINFTLVNDPLFFSETTSGDNTLIVEKAIGTDRLSLVSKNVNERIKDINREKKPYKSLIESEIETKEKVTADIIKIRGKIESLQKVEDNLKKEMEEYIKVKELITKLDAQVKIGKGIIQLNEQVDMDLDVLDGLVITLQKLEELETKTVKLREIEQHISMQESKSITNDNILELDNLVELINKMETIKEKEFSIKELKEELINQEEEVLRLTQEEDSILGELDICPLCNQEINGHKH